MTRLPTPGGDTGDWGSILNAFLKVSHNVDGTLATAAIKQAGGVSSVNALVPAANGNVTLTAGDVGAGTYSKPSSGIPASDLDVVVQSELTAASTAVQSVNGKTGTSVTIAEADIANLTSDLAALVPKNTTVNGHALSANVTIAESDIAGLTTNLSNRVQLGGDLGGTTTVPLVAKLQGTNVNASTPADAQVLIFSSGSNAWVPGTVSSTTVNDATTLSKGIVQLGGDLSGTASSPTVTSLHLVNDTAIGHKLTTVTDPTSAQDAATKNYVDTQVTGGATPDATTLVKGKLQLAGDLSGTAAAPTVAKVNGVSVSGTPTNGQVITASSGSTASWSTPASSPVTSVAGKTGVVTLAEGDIANLTTDLGNKANDTAVVHKSDFTAKGVLLAGTGVSTYGALAVGTDGQVLSADSTQSSGVKWNTPTAAPVTSVAGKTGVVTLAEGDVANLTTDLGNLVPKTTTVNGHALSSNVSVTAGDVGAIPTSTATTKGDLLAATAASTVARLGVGTDGQVLTADSSQTTGIKWATSTAPVTSVAGKTGAVTLVESDIANLTTDLAATEKTANKGVASGYAPLDGSSKVPIANIPTGTSSTTVAAGNDTRITGAIQSSTATTKGDLLAATAASTVARLGVGTDGQVLTADSTQGTGVKWNTPASISGLMTTPTYSGTPPAGLVPKSNGSGGSTWNYISKSDVTSTGVVYTGGTPAFSLVGYTNGVVNTSSTVTNSFGHAQVDTGNAAVIIVSVPAAATVSVTDLSANTYAQIATTSTTSDVVYVFASYGVRQVTPQQITVTQTVSQKMNLALFNCPGVTGIDVVNTATGSSNTPSVASGTQTLYGDLEVALFSNAVAYTNATPSGWAATPNLGVGPFSNGYVRTSSGPPNGDTCTSGYAASQAWCAIHLAFRTNIISAPGATSAGASGYVADAAHVHPAETAWLNVKNFGAKGDGTTDDTAAINLALAAAGAGTGHTVVYLPTGNYRTTAALTYTSKQTLWIRGDGVNGWNNGTMIWWEPGNTIYNVLDIGGGATNTSSVHISDLQITTRTSWVLDPTTVNIAAGYVGINCTSVGNVTIERVEITNGFSNPTAYPPTTGIKIVSAGGSRLMDLPSITAYGDAIWMNGGQIMTMYNVGMGTRQGSGGAGIKMDNGAQSLYMANSGVQGNGDRGIYIVNGGLVACENFSVNPVSVCGVELVAGSGFWGHQLWMSHSGGGNTPLIHGFVVDSAFAGGIYLSDCTFQDWTGYGMLVNGGKGIIVRNSSFGISGSFTGAPHTYDDLHIASAASNITIEGNHFNADPFMGQSANGVRSSVYLESGVNNVSVTGNLFVNNGGGYGLAAVVNLGATNVQIKDNIGYNPIGKLSSPPAVAASGTAVTNSSGTNVTVYVTCGSGVSVSIIAIGGNATGLTVSASSTSQGIRLPANQTISLTYTGGTPTWAWFGE